ncbi:MAG: NAD-dependent epimerase/dehydratase family protein [Demequinaceae bacterium]|nr:NAD-dependent epimerase/dehydratase family protein [Demequinaceae bacterium]
MYEVAVVGSSGFLGGAVMNALAAAGCAAVGFTLDRPLFADGVLDGEAGSVRTVVWCASRINPRLASERPELVEQDRADLAEALAHFDSWERPPRVIAFSSGGTVYGPPAVPPYAEAMETAPVNEYGAAKLGLERQLAASGLDTVSLRVANAYGPGQRPAPGQGVLAHWMEAVLSGGEVHLYGDASATRDYVYVDDIASAVLTVHLAVAPPPVVNVGTGVPTTLDRLLESLEFAVAPARFDTVRHPARATDTEHSTLDVTLAREALGWAPAVSLNEGVARMWNWRVAQ